MKCFLSKTYKFTLITIGIYATLLPLAPSTSAALPGARSETVSGDVFLGGDYIELGLSQYGSFGTDQNKPASFFGTAARNLIGMSADYDGFDTGTDWRMDYFMPGTQEERWHIGYKISGVSTTASNARRAGSTQITDNTVTNQSSGNTLKATSVGTYASNLKITQVVEFQSSDRFFKNTVTLENIHGTNTLDEVRYMRSFDPDNTVDKGGSYTTQNTIVYTHAAGDAKAVVQADTSNNNSDPVYTGTGGASSGTRSPILFYSSDTRARVAYHSGLNPGNVYSASVYNSVPAKGSTEARDGAISIAFDVGTMTPGQTQTFIYYTSLDSRDFSEVIQDIEEDESGTPAVSTPGNITTTDTTATITWSTDIATSSQVEYGLVPTYGFTSAETNTSPRVTSHSLQLSNLKSCARYYYRTVSRTSDNTVTNSDQSTFTTTGCPTSSIIEGSQELLTTTGGNVSYTQGGYNAQLSLPNNFHSQTTQVQINRLSSTAVNNLPSNADIVGGNIYDLIAVDTNNTQVNSFSQPLTFTITYSSAIETQFDESTLDIFRYNGNSWDKQNCLLNTNSNTLTCTLNSFSVYAIIGTKLNLPQAPPTEITTLSCPASQPLYAPHLYQIDSSLTTATLYFAPPPDNLTGYVIEYGNTPSNFNHATSFNHSDKSGAVSYTINNLSPQTEWYYRVRAQNDCAIGPWSNISSSHTGITQVSVSSQTNEYLTPKDKLANSISQTSNTNNSSQCEYIVQPGDSLWEISLIIYRDANRYTQLIEDNQTKYPTISQHINPGMTLQLRCDDPKINLIQEPDQKIHQEESNQKPNKAYLLNISVKKNGAPVPNTSIEIPGTTLKATTDTQGHAKIEDVSGGKHQLSIINQAFAAEKDINIEGDKEEIDIAINIQVQDSILPNWAWLAIISLLCLFILILIRKKRSKKTQIS